jgi:pyruvate/2-oxoglutarate dehydrogenase complex dihydrolipoamide acyltransferase (E2) component
VSEFLIVYLSNPTYMPEERIEKNRGYTALPITFNRRMVAASASVTKTKNTIHCITEVDISVPRKLIKEHFERTGEKLSLTAYLVNCLAQAIKAHPMLNAFQKGRKLIVLDDVTISVLIEREIEGEKVPEPIGVTKAQTKSFREIHNEIREAQSQKGNKLGSLSGMTWVRLIPDFLLRTFVRIADRNIRLAKRFGKVSITAVGMFSKDSAWFIPHGTTTVLITVGSISNKVIRIDENYDTREHLCLTASFDHNIVDGAPATRFMKHFTEIVKSGSLLEAEADQSG